MAYIEMPKLSDTMTEGTLVKWRVNVGDSITMGDIIAEIETDKATMEMEAFDDGIIAELLVSPGQTVKLGDRIARLESAESATPATSSPPKSSSPGTEPAVPQASEKPPIASTPSPIVRPAGERLRASPLARKLAELHGVDLSAIVGTGPGGRVVQKDVLAAVGMSKAAAEKAAAAAPVHLPPPTLVNVPVIASSAESSRIPLSNMRRVIAERLLASKTQIPHFYLTVEVDAKPLVAFRTQLNEAAEAEGIKFTINDLILRAAILSAVHVPKINSAFAHDSIVQYHTVHLAVAIAVEDGLVTPVIRNAERKSLREISAVVKDLSVRARGKKLKPEEFQGGTITVSNLGAFGVDSFSAIINPPQAAILSVGAIVKKPVVGPDDQIVAGQRLCLGLSCDHRVVDGAIAAEYLASMRKLVENPALMLV